MDELLRTAVSATAEAPNRAVKPRGEVVVFGWGKTRGKPMGKHHGKTPWENGGNSRISGVFVMVGDGMFAECLSLLENWNLKR